ncbi:MAG: hypothetical protein ABI759_11950 [Candidatus Solibacter sp.]
MNGLPKLSPWKKILLDFLLVFLFTAILIKPYFKAKYTDKWASIESTFIADARFLADHWPHPQWQPLWYGGTRFDYIYPPMLRYGSALGIRLFGWWPVRAYHFYAALLYSIGIAGVYFLVRIGMKSRGGAYLAAISTALMSPIFLFMPRFRSDAWLLHPQRLGVLVKYGEGPHMSALALIPLALGFTWLALEKSRPWAIAAAAIFAAGVASNNFYGATALATFYPILVWAFWITRQQKNIVLPALAIPVLAYGLTAFWLVPSYFKVTAENMKYVSEHGTTWSIWVALAVAIVFAVASDKLAKGKSARTWEVFLTGAVVFFSLNVLGNYYFNFRVSGEPLRLLPELDMIYIMTMVYFLAWMWQRPQLAWHGVAALIVASSFWTTHSYLMRAWDIVPSWPDHTNRVEYQITEWLAKNLPDARHYPSGSVRFWFDTWRDLTQIGGGSEQGLLNGMVENAQWETNLGPKAPPTIAWMQSMGADTVYVADEKSQEFFKDFMYPRKFDGVLPILYDDHQGNVVFQVPRRWPARIRVVDTAKINAAEAPRYNDDMKRLNAYVDVIEHGPDAPATLQRAGTDAMRAHAKVEPGQSVLVQESYDVAWHATAGGKPVNLRRDPMGMMLLDPPPGEHEIVLTFETPLENLIGRLVTLLTLAAVAALFVVGYRRERRA